MRKDKWKSLLIGTLLLNCLVLGSVGCSSRQAEPVLLPATNNGREVASGAEGIDEWQVFYQPTASIETIVEGLAMVSYAGDYGFNTFLEQGGATSDRDVVNFLTQNWIGGEGLIFQNSPFGCSTVATVTTEGERLFGRNFDWQHCEALIVRAQPEEGYSSLSTVNMNFIGSVGSVLNVLPDSLRALAALYAPLDGMNDQGLCVAVNMIQDSARINQNTGKAGLTTTTAVRMLLDQAANVEEAITLLENYDLHGSMGMMVHFALADRTGRSVVVEYINNQMSVVETPVVTNFYLTEGDKYGIGTTQSHTRYNSLIEQLEANPTMSMARVRDALDSVSKKNFGEFESTEWSIVYNQTSGEVHYYHRENYEEVYRFRLVDTQ